MSAERRLVDSMAQWMVHKLDSNRGKHHWQDDRISDDYLALRLYEEVGELLAALRDGDRDDAWAEAADVANFAAMLADRKHDLIPALPYEQTGR